VPSRARRTPRWGGIRSATGSAAGRARARRSCPDPDTALWGARSPAVLVEKRKRDLTLVDPFWHNRDVAYANMDLPTTNRRYGADDFSGVTAARMAAENAPVDVVDRDDVNRGGLREVGFRTGRASGSHYELIGPRY
jgi:hypothetical protein